MTVSFIQLHILLTVTNHCFPLQTLFQDKKKHYTTMNLRKGEIVKCKRNCYKDIFKKLKGNC